MIIKPHKPVWGWNSYDCYGVFINEEQALKNLDAFIRKLQPHGYEYFCIDAGWYSEYEFQFSSGASIDRDNATNIMDEYGRLVASPRLFPRSLKFIADQVHAAGLKFGIHIMRGIPREAVKKNLPVKGTSVHAADIANTSDICEWCPFMYGVDMNKPGAQAYYNSVMEYLACEGVDLIKADDLTPYPAEIDGIVQAVESCGRDMVLSLSPGDFCSRTNFKNYRQASMLRVTSDVWDTPGDITKCFDRWDMWADLSTDDCRIDLDMIPFGALQVYTDQAGTQERLSGVGARRMSRFTPEQKRTFITMQALAASPLLMGGELTQTAQEDFDLITNTDILACSANGITGRAIYYNSYLDVRKTPCRDKDNHGWIGIFNRFCTPKGMRITADMLGLQPETHGTLHDIWQDRIIDFSLGFIDVEILPGDVLFIRY